MNAILGAKAAPARRKTRIHDNQRYVMAMSAQQPACVAAGESYGHVMPRISAFYGVVIYMYWNERDHPVAHFHAYHAGRRASVSIDGSVLAGALEPRALAFVRDWAKLHRADLLANWERARRNEPLLAIPPLP
jgi:Domain of unknown function (DUF4160)